jgi:Tfp pilus assembly protein PilF
MGELLLSERRDLIAQYVDQAQINWAHLCIALLMQAGYVDRVLTTNFDLLVARACAMLGVFPAIYDFATSQLLKKADIPDQAVFYLHGQRTGFVLMNTEEDMERHSKLLGPVFEDAGSGRVWIVVGYSGENDPVFEHLANIPRFDNGLFWIGYGDREPANHVRERLLTQEKDAFFTKGFDADSFFVSLTRTLGIFPPDLVARPFSYLQRALTYIAPFTNPGQTFEDDVMQTPLNWIHNAINQFETPAWELIIQQRGSQKEVQKSPGLLAVAARYLLMQGRFEQVLTFHRDYDELPSEELADMLSMAYVMRGNQFLDRAKARGGSGSDELFLQAKEDYKTALLLKPNRHEALHNWGNLLLDLAKIKAGEEADQLFSEAEEKYKDALKIKPEMPDVLINWGNLLLDRAKTKSGKKADELFIEAEKKYLGALEIKPGLYEALYQWGNVFLDRAKTRKGVEADRLFDQAVEKYGAALKINPDMYQALNNWGHVFLDRAKTKEGQEADHLFAEAEKKYRAALEIKPDQHNTLNNWGNVLSDRARRKTGEEADDLFAQAEKKYLAALEIKPDLYDALNNWGNLLLDWGKTKTGTEADHLFAEAEKKYSAALEIKPDRYDILNNWGNVLSDRARRKTGEEADHLFAEAEKKYRAALDIRSGTPDVLHNWGNLLQDWSRTKTGAEAARLLAGAEEKFQSAGASRPSTPDSRN